MRFKKSDEMYQLEARIGREANCDHYEVEEEENPPGVYNVIGFTVFWDGGGVSIHSESDLDRAVA